MRSATLVARSYALLLLVMACGSSTQTSRAPAPSPSPGVTDAGLTDAQVAHPFASTVIEAQSLIQEQIDAHMKTLWKCVNAYRATGGDPHKPVVVDVGIDQEGVLLGVTSPSTKQIGLDPVLKQCLFDGLHGLPFPSSHAGIITVRQTFTDQAVSP
jgi:hypothetical protein